MDWFRSVDAQLMFTGSVKQSIAIPPLFIDREYATPSIIEKHVRQVMDRASRDILGRYRVKKGCSLRYAVAIEGQDRPLREGGERLHAHIAIGGIPDNFPLDKAAEIIERRWRRNKWGYDNNISRKITSESDRTRCFAYLLKRLQNRNTDRYFIRLSAKNDETYK